MTFGNKLQALRARAGLSQEELAARLGVSRQAVSKWELDKAAPDAAYIVAISILFAVTTDYLLKDDAPETPPPVGEGTEPVSIRKTGPAREKDPSRVSRLLLTGGSALILAAVLLYLAVYCFDFGYISWLAPLTILLVLIPPVLLAVSRGLLGWGPVSGRELKQYRRSFALCTALWGFAIALPCGFQDVMDYLLVDQYNGPFSIPIGLALTAVLGLALYCLGLLLGNVLTRRLQYSASA